MDTNLDSIKYRKKLFFVIVLTSLLILLLSLVVIFFYKRSKDTKRTLTDINNVNKVTDVTNTELGSEKSVFEDLSKNLYKIQGSIVRYSDATKEIVIIDPLNSNDITLQVTEKSTIFCVDDPVKEDLNVSSIGVYDVSKSSYKESYESLSYFPIDEKDYTDIVKTGNIIEGYIFEDITDQRKNVISELYVFMEFCPSEVINRDAYKQ